MLSVCSECWGWSKSRWKRLGGKSHGRAAALELHFQAKVRMEAACYERKQCNIFFNSKLFADDYVWEGDNAVSSEQKKKYQKLTLK